MHSLVRMAGRIVAVDTAHAGEVIRNPQVQALDLGGSEIAGILRRRGHQMPVLAGPHALGLAGGRDAAGLMLLLTDGSRWVALPLDAVHSVQLLDTSSMQLAVDAGLAPGSFFSGLTRTGAGESALVLDSARVLDAFAVAGLARDEGSGQRAQSDGRRDAAGTEAHIVVRAGQEWAIPMSSVHEIVPLPGDFEPAPMASEEVVGNAAWRGRALPVLDVAGRGGAAARDQQARMIVVQHGERYAALLADELTALLPANSAARSRFRVPGGSVVDMLTVGDSAARRSYRVMNLDKLPFFSTAQ
jgi:purine-binding chemotaxis protein CheW